MKHRIALLRNVALVAAAGHVEAAVGLIAGVVIARTLGPADFGHYAFSIWLCGVLIMVGNNALPTSSIKFLAEARGAERPDVAAALLHRFARWQFFSSAIVIIVFGAGVLVWPLSDWRDSLPLMVGIAAVAVWARAGFWMRGALGKGYEMFVPENVTLIITAALNLLLILILAWRGASVTEFFAVYAVLGVFANVVVRAMLSRADVTARPGPIPEELYLRLRHHLVLTGILMLLTTATNRAVEMTLLKIHVSSETVGYFAIAATLTKGAVDLLVGGMSAVLLPAMSRRHGSGGANSLASIFAESTRLYWFLGLAIAGLGLTVSEGLIHLLYGARYEGAIAPLMWHLVIIGLVVVHGSAAAVLTASDRQLDRIRVIVCAFVVNLVLGLVLIPRYGLSGAVASYGLTQVFCMLFTMWYARRRIKSKLPLAAMARLALAATVATSLSYATVHLLGGELAFVAGAAVFTLFYVALSVLLRTWRAADFETIASVMARLGGVGLRASERVMTLRRFALTS